MKIVRGWWLAVVAMMMLTLGCCTTQSGGNGSCVDPAKPIELQRADVGKWLNEWGSQVQAELEHSISEVVTVGSIYEHSAVVVTATMDAIGWTHSALRPGSSQTWGSVLSVGLNAGRSGLILSGIYDRRVGTMDHATWLTVSSHVASVLLDGASAGLEDGVWSVGEIIETAWSLDDCLMDDLDLGATVLRHGNGTDGPLLLSNVLSVARTTAMDSLVVFDVANIPVVVLID